MKLKFFFHLFIVILLISLVALNQYYHRTYPRRFNQIRQGLTSLSFGDRYYAILQMWHYFAQKQDWEAAQNLEKYLDPQDLAYYKLSHHPADISQNINSMLSKSPKSIEDNLEIARLYFIINQSGEAAKYLKAAYDQDPVRPDLEKYYLQFASSSDTQTQ
jgi:hypothetical protein